MYLKIIAAAVVPELLGREVVGSLSASSALVIDVPAAVCPRVVSVVV